MIEHHFAVIYNSTTGSWYMDIENVAFPGGAIYDTSDGQFRFIADDEIDEDMKAYSMLYESLKELTKQTDKLVGR